jgi:hypothetical protein
VTYSEESLLALRGGGTAKRKDFIMKNQTGGCQSYSRFVAVLDILGMKQWLNQESASDIANKIEAAFWATPTLHDKNPPLEGNGIRGTNSPISIAHFSDTMLLWSPDDSWASLCRMLSAIISLIPPALADGVPLRGSISVGEAVCLPEKLRFVGQPIVDAFLWSEKNRSYRSVGVDLTPCTIQWLNEKHLREPMPRYMEFEGSDNFSTFDAKCRYLIKYDGLVMVDHWQSAYFIGEDPVAMFNSRKLECETDKDREDVRVKISQMEDFLKVSRALPPRIPRVLMHADMGGELDQAIALSKLRLSRDYSF